MRVGIVGAGIVGRLLAWHLCQRNIQVFLFDQESVDEGKGCSWVAAGMISPLAERPILPEIWYQMGLESLILWPKILQSLSLPVFYQAKGSLVVCYPQQKSLLLHFIETLKRREANLDLSILDQVALSSFEPALNSLIGCYLPDEAWVNPSSLFKGLAHYLSQKVNWYAQHTVKSLSATTINTNKGKFIVDKVFDCRGLGAKYLLPALRGVRGEILFCQSKTIKLNHAIRLLHARFPCYIVPHGNKIYAIGATHIENETRDGVKVQSALELLSAAISVHPEFREANIIALKSHLRPTSVSHVPIVEERNGITHINGMFRHGFLLAPALTAKIALNLGR